MSDPEQSNVEKLFQSSKLPRELIKGQIPGIGDAAPAFTAEAVVNGKFTDISLESLRGKWVVLVFYPLDFTFVCPTEIISFSEKAKDFRAINTEVLAISVDSKYSHHAWTNLPRNKGGLGAVDIPLVADYGKTITWKYGATYLESGHGLRALYIIDPSGILKHISMNDLPVGRSADETYRLVTAFQHAAETGQVCPANWKKGDASMIPDPEKSLEYFRQN